MTLRTALPDPVGSLNAAFPPVRRFARAAVPGVRSTGPTVDDLLPLDRPSFAASCPPRASCAASHRISATSTPLADAVRPHDSVPLLGELRTLASCVSTTLVPYGNQTHRGPELPGHRPGLPGVPEVAHRRWPARAAPATRTGSSSRSSVPAAWRRSRSGNGLLGAATRPMQRRQPAAAEVGPAAPDRRAVREPGDPGSASRPPGAPPPQTRVEPERSRGCSRG